MRPEQESFEETQQRLTGTSPGPWRVLRQQVKRINWMKVIVPAAFVAVPAAVAIRDAVDERDMPAYVFATIYLLIFLLAASLFAFGQSARANKRRK